MAVFHREREKARSGFSSDGARGEDPSEPNLYSVVFEPEPAMARKRRRYNPNFVAVRVQSTLALGALASGSVASATLMGNAGQDLYLLSADLIFTHSDGLATEGPINVGVCHGDYSTTEIDEWYVSTAGVGTDMIMREHSRRKVREAGQFPGIAGNETLNDGKPIRVKLRFDIADNINLDVWARNSDATAPLSSGGEIVVSGTVYCLLK